MRHELEEFGAPVVSEMTPAGNGCADLSPEECRLCERVQSEFYEMPGLTLTVPQASRLFSLERHQCQRILEALVDTGYLVADGRALKYRCASDRCA
jgi:hypothetical protein